MKKILLFMFVAGFVSLSCNEFDDSKIWAELNSQGDRITKLEQLCSQMNTNIEAVQTILKAYSENDYVTFVAPITQGGEEIGYTITFSKSGTITIYHGRDGKDGLDGKPGTDGKDGVNGKDGYTPAIGVRQDVDGVYYWTLDGEWLLDSNGNKIKAQGQDGKDGNDGADGQPGQDGVDGEDGVTPQLKIDDAYWYISYDSGLTWTQLGKATGEDGENGSDGADGKDGDSLFDSIVVDSETQTVSFVLSDGSSFVLPMATDNAIAFEETSVLYISGKTTIPLIINTEYQAVFAEVKNFGNNSSMVTKSDAELWSVEIDTTADMVTVTIAPSAYVEYGSKALLSVTLVDNNGNNHSISRVIVCNVENQDIPDTKVTNLSLSGTANCYIVSEAGNYKFYTFKGNSTSPVGSVATAEVLWETFGTDVAPKVGDLVSEVSYSDGCISFKASDKKGNASIAAKDASGNILWSWHIWMTDSPEDQVYNNYAGTMMDRNLGAISATPGDVGALGLMYQWGRKDPFLGGASLSDQVQAKSTLASWPDAVVSTESTGTVEYVTANPTTFVKVNNINSDWWYSGVEDVTDNTRWTSIKTIYDPCPTGYRVPDGGSTGVWAVAFGNSLAFRIEHFDKNNRGFNFGKNQYRYLTEEETCWYPAAGGLRNAGAQYSSVGGRYGSYWSCTPSASVEHMVHSLSFEYRIIDNRLVGGTSTFSARIGGSSIRCLKENSSGIQNNAADLSKGGTANSYVVSEPGLYKISPVKGNSKESVGNIESVEVVWETYGTDVTPGVGDLVSDAIYYENYIYFKASDKKGNALIAAKDAGGKILWSWHIWMTDKPKDQVYCNNAGTMMDRNLGATSATPGDVGTLGLLYQWGRKDPFLGSSSISSNTYRAASTCASWLTAQSTEEYGTIQYATAHPTVTIGMNTNNYDWYYSKEEKVTDDTRWTGIKTIYDPCPAGYRVPHLTVWATAFGVPCSLGDSYNDTYDAVNNGFNFGKGNSEMYLTDDAICWYPAAGWLNKGNTYPSSTGNNGFYWSCNPDGFHAFLFNIYYNGRVHPLATTWRVNAQSVRCLKE